MNEITIRMTTNWLIEVKADDVNTTKLLNKIVKYLQTELKTNYISASIVEESVSKGKVM